MISLLRAARSRPHLLGAVAIGLLAYAVLPGHLALRPRLLIAWDVGCAAFLVGVAVMFSMERKTTIAQDAERQQEGEWTIFWLTVVGSIASFAAIVGEFSASKNMPSDTRAAHVTLVAATLLLSWLLTHALFALRYAHEYYESCPGSADVARGLEFPGKEDPDYWDFVYFALVLGMTFQVSDVQITSRKLRRLAAAHGMLGFLFNTVLLALSVNIGASLL